MLSVIVSACGGGNRDYLEKADKIMEESPDSALRILQEIDTMSLKNNKERGGIFLADDSNKGCKFPLFVRPPNPTNCTYCRDCLLSLSLFRRGDNPYTYTERPLKQSK